MKIRISGGRYYSGWSFGIGGGNPFRGDNVLFALGLGLWWVGLLWDDSPF